MKKEMIIKRVLSSLIAVTLVLTAIVVTPKNVNAAENTNDVVYEETTENVYAAYKNGTIPEKEGYIFAGWYEKSIMDGSTLTGKWSDRTVMESARNDASLAPQCTAEELGKLSYSQVYAKWVPAYVLGVKAQNHVDVESNGSLRVFSSVDNLYYDSVGFDIYFNNDTSLSANAEATSKVYEVLIANDEPYTADLIFGQKSNFFSVLNITGIGSSNFNKIIYVRPYWVTYDGMKVYGLAKYVHVVDGLQSIVNVPVNIYTAQAIAAGILQVSYDDSMLQLLDGSEGWGEPYETGRMLGELEIADKGNAIKCAGNITDITNDKMYANTDLYVNLRFKVIGEYTFGESFLTFDVSAVDFCDSDENAITNMDSYIWDIQY